MDNLHKPADTFILYQPMLIQHRAIWCGVVWCGVVWCGVVWCGVGPLLSFAFEFCFVDNDDDDGMLFSNLKSPLPTFIFIQHGAHSL